MMFHRPSIMSIKLYTRKENKTITYRTSAYIKIQGSYRSTYNIVK